MLLVKVKDGKPQLAGRLPVRGQIRESRLVGDALYVASYDWFQPPPQLVNDPGNVVRYIYSAWESSTTVQGFDLADPAQPGLPPVATLAANPDALMATERFLFVATTGVVTPKPGEAIPGWTESGSHAVIVFDISDPHGTVNQMGVVRTAIKAGVKFGVIGFIFFFLAQMNKTRRGLMATF